MKKEIVRLIQENKLSCFNSSKSSVKDRSETIFKTKDAKAIFTKVIEKISENFMFRDTPNIWKGFHFTIDENEIMKRQEYFRGILLADNSLLKAIKAPRNSWKPKYNIVVVTADEKIFLELQKLDCPLQFLNSESDVQGLEDYDVVQAIECDDFSRMLEQLPGVVFLDNVEDVYLERYLETLSGWKDNLEAIKNIGDEEIRKIVEELSSLFVLMNDKSVSKISRDDVEIKLEEINNKVSEELGKMSLSGSVLIDMLSKGKYPQEVKEVVEKAISESGINEEIYRFGIPVSVDEHELEKIIKVQNANQFTDSAERIKNNAAKLKKVPELLKKLDELLLIFDFEAGVFKMIKDNRFYPSVTSEVYFSNAENIFLDSAQPISFNLNNENRCSMLTGANSGGKTTLLEHIIQIISFLQIGLPCKGEVKMPIFSDIYYFAKTKGSASKGAFETLLTQMAGIKPGNKTLILADEIEAVTEPGVAGKVICATAEFFLERNCFLIIATHLGQEIQKNLPPLSRIDGIEAKGLDEEFNLIVDHNPVLGRLASSTPELIIEKMSKISSEDYFKFLNERVRKS